MGGVEEALGEAGAVREAGNTGVEGERRRGRSSMVCWVSMLLLTLLALMASTLLTLPNHLHRSRRSGADFSTPQTTLVGKVPMCWA